MKTLTNANARDLRHAATLVQQARQDGRRAVFAGGGSDVLALMKDRIVTPDVVVNLKTIRGLDGITASRDGTTIGGLITLDALSRDRRIHDDYRALAEAAGIVATPQIRNVATLAGNVCQRPWCWYYRNGFQCYKAGGTQCFSAAGENRFHAIFGGGPSYIVHPSDAAPALMALDATFRVSGPAGERRVPASEFFVLPRRDVAHENVLGDDEILASARLPPARPGTRSTYKKVMDREAWTHALVSAAVVLEMDGAICRRARVVLGGVAPIPWRLPEVEQLLAGQTVTQELATRAGELAVAGARPLRQNAYKVPMTRALVRRTIAELAGVRS
jgi:xanthine dehydrogenase YagS FAD-binding subunit